MNDERIMREYKRLRRERNYPASVAASVARGIVNAPRYEWDTNPDHAYAATDLFRGPFQVHVELHYDDDHDITDECPLTYAEAYEYERHAGQSKSVARDNALKAVERYERSRESVTAYGCIVTVSFFGDELGNASLWGCEISDRLTSWSEELYDLEDFADGVIDEALSEASAKFSAYAMLPMLVPGH